MEAEYLKKNHENHYSVLFSMINCKITVKPNSSFLHVLMKILLPPRNLLIFYNTPLECLGKIVSSKTESYPLKME